MNLRLRIVLALCVFGLVPGMLVLHTYRNLDEIYGAEMQAYFDVGARNLMDDIDHMLLQQRREMDSLALNLANLARHQESGQRAALFSAELRARMVGESRGDRLAFIGTRGELLAGVGLESDANAGFDGAATAGTDWFQRALRNPGASLLMGPARGLLPGSAASERLAVVVARAVLGEGGTHRRGRAGHRFHAGRSRDCRHQDLLGFSCTNITSMSPCSMPRNAFSIAMAPGAQHQIRGRMGRWRSWRPPIVKTASRWPRCRAS